MIWRVVSCLGHDPLKEALSSLPTVRRTMPAIRSISSSAGPTSRFYVSQRLRLHYVDWGNPDAPPLILLHGGRDHSRSWDWTAAALRNDWHVIAPDLRGHGDSAWSPDGAYMMPYFIHDLAQLIHQLETNQAEAASLADQLASAQERLATAEATETQLIAGQAEQEARNARLVAELAEDAEMKQQLQDTARELRRKELDHSMVMEDLAVSKDR